MTGYQHLGTKWAIYRIQKKLSEIFSFQLSFITDDEQRMVLQRYMKY